MNLSPPPFRFGPRHLVLVLALACAAPAQGQEPAWFTPDGSAPGTPATAMLDERASTPERSVMEIVIHGFWMTPMLGDDGRPYQQISVPGLQTTMEFGFPELPVHRFGLGIVTDAPMVTLADVSILGEATYSGVLPYPHIIGAIPDSIPHPERFVRDENAYGSPIDYPGGYAQRFEGVDPGTGGLRVGVCEVHPFHWNASGELRLHWRMLTYWDHSGQPRPVEMGSAKSASAASGALANGSKVAPYLTWDHLLHRGYFLFVVPAGLEPELTPLIEQKQKRGFWTTVIHTQDIPPPGMGEAACNPTRQAIRNWYLGTPSGADHYCILAGTANQIPPCYSPRPMGYELGTSLTTDDYFGDVDGNGFDDEGMEVYVGRLPANNAPELSIAVARILAYEDSPSYIEEFDHAALIGWNSSVDNRFQNALNVVASAPYAFATPVFDKVNGGLAFVNNTWIDGVAQTDGIVAYNGHGSSTAWGDWNTHHEWYSNVNIDAVANDPVHPIVWSFACLTGDIRVFDCMGHHWLMHGGDGAAGFYGATMLSWIYDNGIMVRRLFDAVFHRGYTTLGRAIAFAEFGTVLETSADNPVQYLLIGDPEMHLRYTNVAGPPYVLDIPDYIVAGPVPPLDINVHLPNGGPAENVKVALWKRATPSPYLAATSTHASEVLDNRYTDAQGNAHFELPAVTAGTLYVTVMDDDQGQVIDSIGVTSGVSVDLGGSRSRLGVAGSVARGRVEFLLPGSWGEGARLVVHDVSGRSVRTLRITPGARSITWDGVDERGGRARPGFYLASLEGGAAERQVVRFVLLE